MFGGKTVSIDIGSKNLHIVEGAYKGNMVEIEKMVDFPTPTNSYIEGRIEDKAALKEAIRASLSQHKINSKEVILSIKGPSIISRELSLPEIKEEQLKSMVRYEMEQYLPEAISGYVVEFRVLGKTVEDQVNKLKIRAAAMPKEIVSGYFDLVSELKLRPVSLDTHLNSISKLFDKPTLINSQPYNSDQTIAIIDFGHRNTIVNVLYNGIIDFSRPVSYGSRDIDTAISSYYDIKLDQAEQKKINELRLDKLDSDSESAENSSISVKSVLQQWMSELQKVLQYYISRNPERRINALFIYGNGANLKGLPEYLKQYLDIKLVQKISSMGNVKIKGMNENTDIGACLNAIGALIRL